MKAACPVSWFEISSLAIWIFFEDIPSAISFCGMVLIVISAIVTICIQKHEIKPHATGHASP